MRSANQTYAKPGKRRFRTYRQKQRLAFIQEGKSDSESDNEYDRDKQMKCRNNFDNQNESEVWKPT